MNQEKILAAIFEILLYILAVPFWTLLAYLLSCLLDPEVDYMDTAFGWLFGWLDL